MSPADCQYRSDAEGESSCRLLGDFFATDRADLTACSYEICNACCLSSPPTPTSINSSVASLLLLATIKVIEEKGIPSCDLARAEHLQNWALKNISVAGEVEKPPQSKKADYQGPCFYLGDQIGERRCASCTGNVRQKEFSCGHEGHESTVIRDCMNCTDYEAGLSKLGIKSWAVGVTTAPRREPNLPEMLLSLKKAGWGEARIFAEPECEVEEEGGFTVTQRRETMGAWPNFLLGLTELTLSHPQADAYFMCQDDALFCGGLRKYLEGELWLDQNVGVVSLHTPSHQTHNEKPGFFEGDVGWSSWGAMAFIFSNASARALLRHPAVINHRNRGMGEGLRNVDSVVGNWCRLAGLPYYLHAPSLCEHIGLTTTLWKADSLEGRRSSSDFPGEDVEISSWMEEKLAEKEYEDPEVFHSASSGSPGTLRSNLAVIARGDEKDLPFFLESVERQSLSPDERWMPGQNDREVSGWHCPGKDTPLQGIMHRLTSEWVMVLDSLKELEGDLFTPPDDDRVGMVSRERYVLLRRSAAIQAGEISWETIEEIVPKIRELGWIVLDGKVGTISVIPDGLSLPEEIAAYLNREILMLDTEFVHFLGEEESSAPRLDRYWSCLEDGMKPGALIGDGAVQVKRIPLWGALVERRALCSCLPLRGSSEEWISAELRRQGYTLWGEE